MNDAEEFDEDDEIEEPETTEERRKCVGKYRQLAWMDCILVIYFMFEHLQIV